MMKKTTSDLPVVFSLDIAETYLVGTLISRPAASGASGKTPFKRAKSAAEYP